MLAIVGLPSIVGLLTFRTSGREHTTNYGTIVEPNPLPAEELAEIGGHRFTFSALRGRWILVMPASTACEDACRQRLYLMRQIRTALGKDMGRVERVWLLTDAGEPDGALLAAHPGLHAVRADASAAAALMKQQESAASGFFLVDPMGNLMLRYPDRPDARRVLKDLEHLLRLSRVG